MFKISKIALLVTGATFLSACSSTGLKKNTWRAEAITTKQTIEVERVEDGIIKRLGDYAGDDNMPFEGIRDFFNDDTYINLDEKQYVHTRDNVQFYLKGISEIKCGDFKTHSLAEQANVNLGLSSAATILGGVGGLLSPEGTAQALSASASMVTGIQSVVNQNYYREKTFEIITKAIDVRRKTLWANIEAKRIRDNTNDNYSYVINDAIADMIEYNNACSVIAGFEEIANSVKDKEKQVDRVTALQKLGSSTAPGTETASTDGPPTIGKDNINTLSVEEFLASQ